MLIERDAETETIDRSLASVPAGTGTAIVIEAPAGTGKSALLDLAERRARDAGWLVRRAAHGPAERQFRFGIVRTLLEQPLGAGALLLEEGDATTIAHGLFWACAALAEERPLALLVDDAHWADRASLETLAYLARRARDIPLLIVVAARSGVVAGFGGIQDATVLEPGPLSPAGSARLIRRYAPDAAAELCDRCHREAAGNPWLLRELAHEIATGHAGPLSDSGRIVLRHRLGQLTAAERRVARALSIAGDGTDAHRLAEVADVAAGDLGAVRDALVAAGLCAPDGWRFVHGLLARAVCDEMPAAVRDRLHRAAADALRRAGGSPALVAAHLLECGPAADPDASAVLREAAASAAAQGAPHGAAAYLERALLERAEGDDRALMLAQLGTAAFHAGLPGARERLHEAIAACPDGPTRVEILTRLAALEVIDPQDETLSERLGDGDGDAADSELALELAGLDALLMYPERHEERARRLRALDPGAIRDGTLRADALAHQAWLGTETGIWDAAACGALAREAVAEDALMRRSGFHLCVRVLTLTDHVADSERAIARLREAMLKCGSVRLGAAVASHAAELALRAGQLPDAEREARIAVEPADGASMVSAAAVAVLVEALVERGEFAEARAVLADRLPPDAAVAGADAGIRHARARLWLAEGDYEAAAAEAREVGRSQIAHGRRNPAWMAWRATLAVALAHLGRFDEAVAVADEDVDLARAFGAPTALARTLHARCVSERNVERRAALAAAALTDCDGAAALALAGLQVELGSALNRLGERIEARDVLRPAFATAGAAGAEPLAERIRRELVASGARPRRSATEGPAALTPRQRQICDLAAAGRSNRAIALELFLSVKTVETHLTRAYGTLGVPDRAGMVAMLCESPSAVPEPARRPASWLRERTPSFA